MHTKSEVRRERTEIAANANEADRDPPEEARDRSFLRWLAIGLVAAAAGLYLLQALGEFLRPVLIAVLLCYAIWPLHAWLSRFVKPGVSLAIIAMGVGLISSVVAWMAFANAEQVWKDAPKYQERAGRLVQHARTYAARVLPASMHPDQAQTWKIPFERAGDYLRNVFGAFASFLAQAALVGLYLVFMMMEASRFPPAIRRAFAPDRAARILEAVASVNQAVIEYLSVKVKVNLLVAVPAALLMLGFRVEGAVLWGVLTFFARFVPYLGGVVAYALPVASATLQFDSPVRAALFAGTLLVIHVVGEYVIEPVMTGKAVGLSPLIVLLALAFWNLAWGIVGMILAVPLTVIVKIALARLNPTRPMSRLLSDDD
jgi:AI-2 transport protein TqsA